MLAAKTIALMTYMPSCQRARMPEMMVSVRAAPWVCVLSTGNTLAGISMTDAANASAAARERLVERELGVLMAGVEPPPRAGSGSG